LKLLIAGLVVLFLLLQGRLWFGDGGRHEVSRARNEVTRLKGDLARQRDINLALRAEVTDLGNGLGEIEERARAELGMIGGDETFYQFVGKKDDAVSAETIAQRQSDFDSRGVSPEPLSADAAVATENKRQ